MNTLSLASDPIDRAVEITRVAEHVWHALEDDQVVGRGDTSRRSDGRLFVSIDAWHGAVFHRLAAAMLADLPTPLHTVVDEADEALTADWLTAGFSIAGRERGYVVPTDPRITGLGSHMPPRDVTIVPAGQADLGELRLLDQSIRAEVAASVGWHTMPAEVLPRPDGILAEDLPKYVVATQDTEYVGLLRLVTWTRQPRIGLLAVRADHRRRGIGRALLAHSLSTLHDVGTDAAWAEVTESNKGAITLFESIHARHSGSTLELVRR